MNDYSILVKNPNPYLMTLANIVARRECVTVHHYRIDEHPCLDFLNVDDDLISDLIAIITADPNVMAYTLKNRLSVNADTWVSITSAVHQSTSVQTLLAAHA